MKPFFRWLATRTLPVVISVGSLVGCAVLRPIVAQAATIAAILDYAESIVDQHFTAHPDRIQEQEIRQAIQATRAALVIAQRLGSAQQELEEGQTQDAVSHLLKAYDRMYGLLLDAHLVGEGVGASAAPTAQIPSPQALQTEFQLK